MIRNLVITGIGGQGVVSCAALLRWAALAAGYTLTGSDNRGGAQRLGHVAAVIRLTDEPDTPLAPDIPDLCCDLLISLEASEGLRYASILGPRSLVIHDSRIVVPTNQRRNRLPYPDADACTTAYRERAGRVIRIDADRSARERFGKAVLGGMILMGAGLGHAGLLNISEYILSSIDNDSAAAFAFGRGLATGADA
ncbi:MAG TPA: 2-oxoacid:acceptor oxidoreductase family protein [Candidatus Ozemobacteraceae bacterium]